jgi:hypothetical protein
MNFIENESPQKLRGGYYTHPDIATFLARWVLKPGPARILEDEHAAKNAEFDRMDKVRG